MRKTVIVLLFFIGVLCLVIAMGSVSAWYDTDWSYRKSITIDHNMVDSDLVNFPVLINITDSDLVTYAQSDFDDILFADSADTKLYHEIERYDSGTGSLLTWVNVSSLSGSVNTVLYMYYGNGVCSDQRDSDGVWNSDYLGVYHLNRSSADKGSDSTSNNYNGAVVGIADVEAIIGQGGDWDHDVGDRIELPFDYGASGEYTIEMWFKTGNDLTEQFLYCYDNDIQAVYTFLTIDGGTFAGFTYDGGGKFVSAGSLVSNEVYHVVLTAKENDNLRIYLNGSFQAQIGIGTFDDYVISDQNNIGCREYMGDPAFDGYIDEVRISNINRSVGFISTNYNSMLYDNTGEGFFDLGLKETVFVMINDSTDVKSTNMVLNGYIGDGLNLSCGFWVGTNTSVNHSYNVQNISVSGLFSVGETFSSSVTSLSPVNLYYVKAWAQNASGLHISSYTTVLMKPEAPTGISTSIINSSAINISWTKGSGANNTVVIRKADSYPSSMTDGSVVGNTTDSYLVVDGLNDDTFYYRLWSYSNWTTADDTFYSHVSDNSTDLVYAFMNVNVFDEATGNPLSNWNITVSNLAGDSVYNSSGNNNMLSINASLLPLGSVSIIISCDAYEQRVYHRTVSISSFHILNAYLPVGSVAQLCRLDVVGSQTEYGADPPVEEAFVSIKEFDNESGIYQTVSSFYTDANGQYFIHLDTNTQYKAVINKSGYDLEISDFIVQSDISIYTFRLVTTSSSVEIWDLFHDVVSLSVDKYSNGSMYVCYVDVGLTTVDTDIFIYEVYNDSFVLNYSDSRTGDNSFSFWVSDLNVYRSHKIVLFFNNSVDFVVDSPFTRVVFPFYVAEHHTFSFDERMRNLIGPFMLNNVDIGWHVIISFLVGLFLLCMFGKFNNGMGIIGCGLGIGFMEVVFAMWFTEDFPVLLVSLCPFIILIGIVYSKMEGSDKL